MGCKVFQVQDIVEENLLQMKSGHINFHKKCHHHDNSFWQYNLDSIILPFLEDDLSLCGEGKLVQGLHHMQ